MSLAHVALPCVHHSNVSETRNSLLCDILQMLEDHLSEKALIPALRFVAENHPERLAKSEASQQKKAQDAKQFQENVKETVPDNGKTTQ